ncbi:MAG TPA: YceI family protein [Gemmatimonadaceae bacterium]|nr:YceI family protein [Gemmatimonadaceae bacterium]
MLDHRSAVVVRLLSLAAVLFITAPAWAQRTVTFSPASKIVIEGKSNVHAWTCATSTFDATATAPELPATESGSRLTALALSIPVSSLDCGHGDMNKNLRKAMHADQHPTVGYRMTSYDATRKGDSYDVSMEGMVTINGVEKPVRVHASVTPNALGGADVVGSAPIRTTDFGVQPVKVMLGTLRTSPDVTITFRLSAMHK